MLIGISIGQVREESPMIASRSMIIYTSLEQSIVEIRNALESFIRARSPGQWLRAAIANEIKWVHGPAWLHRSFTFYDNNVLEFMNTDLVRYPDTPTPRDSGEPQTLANLISAPTAFDGLIVTVIGHQRISGRQFVSEAYRVPSEEPYSAAGPSIVANYVFQLSSQQLPDNQFAYVHCLGPWNPPTTFKSFGPWGNKDDLCWVTGVILAHGSVPMSDGGNGQCIYITASRVMFTPSADISNP